eukprot:gene25785-28321_t
MRVWLVPRGGVLPQGLVAVIADGPLGRGTPRLIYHRGRTGHSHGRPRQRPARSLNTPARPGSKR